MDSYFSLSLFSEEEVNSTLPFQQLIVDSGRSSDADQRRRGYSLWTVLFNLLLGLLARHPVPSGRRVDSQPALRVEGAVSVPLPPPVTRRFDFFEVPPPFFLPRSGTCASVPWTPSRTRDPR